MINLYLLYIKEENNVEALDIIEKLLDQNIKMKVSSKIRHSYIKLKI